jgi:hypothetical protein
VSGGPAAPHSQWEALSLGSHFRFQQSGGTAGTKTRKQHFHFEITRKQIGITRQSFINQGSFEEEIIYKKKWLSPWLSMSGAGENLVFLSLLMSYGLAVNAST